jgi:hypothetical protein
VRLIPLIPLLSLIVAGCEEVVSQKPAALAFNQTLVGASEQAGKALEICGNAYAPAARGEKFDPATVESEYEKGLSLLRQAIASVRAAEGPKSFSTANYKEATLRSLEAAEQRYTTSLRELSRIAMDPKLSLDQKREKGAPIVDKMEKEAKAEDALKIMTQRAFAAEYKLELRPATSH